MLVGNVLVWFLPPARRALDREAVAFPGTNFRESQRDLWRVAAVVVPISLAVGTLGAVLPWN
jgi:hypothetical protein